MRRDSRPLMYLNLRYLVTNSNYVDIFLTIFYICILLSFIVSYLTCRRLFDWFAFILFFYNGIAGVFGAILRALMSSMFGLLLLFRLDRIVLMKGFERYDFGEPQ